jgi:hypothetical protein
MKSEAKILARIKYFKHKELYVKGLLNKDRARIAAETLQWVLGKDS